MRALPVVLLAWLLSACEHRAGPRNVILVTIDTLRADRLGAYGYARPTSPAIDALARESTLFETAVPTCPATAPSVASILTGLHRTSHRVMANGWILPSDVETLAEILKGHGYRTVARVANLALESKVGFAQGFDDFAMPAVERSGPGMFEGGAMTAEAEQLLDTLGDSPFFLWLHFMDPHGPYFPPESHRALFAAADYRWPGETDLTVAGSNYGLFIIPAYQAVEGRTQPADYRARYDAEVRYTDDHIAAIVRKLRARGLWDRSLFILTADHGESLGEHGYYFQHGWFLYDDCLRVPLLLRAPGIFPAGRRVRRSVSLVDVTPTVLDILGLPRREALEGRSLLPVVRDEEADRLAFAQTYYGEGLVALRRGPLKYIFKPPRPRHQDSPPSSEPPTSAPAREELYDLEADPAETRDLATVRRDVVRALRAAAREWLADQERRGRQRVAERSPGAPGGPARVLGDPQLERQLRALGYVN